MTNAIQLATDYFDAWQDGRFDDLRTLLADDCTFIGPLAVIDNAEACVEGLRGMRKIIDRIEVHTRQGDDSDVITWFDLHTTIAPPVATANWSHAENGRITHIRVAFDPREILAAG